jgi:predicted nicotinamide N-methyase
MGKWSRAVRRGLPLWHRGVGEKSCVGTQVVSPPGLPAPAFTFEHARVGKLSLRQYYVDDRDASGLWVWAAGKSLAAWLCSIEGGRFLECHPANDSAGLVAIELGSGPGLVAAVLARCGVGQVVATDADEDAITQCRANAAAHGLIPPAFDVQPLKWGDTAAAERIFNAMKCKAGARSADGTPVRMLIVGSDITYDVGELDRLELTIRALVRGYIKCGGDSLDILMAWQERSGIESGLLLRLKDLGGVMSTLWRGQTCARGLLGEAASVSLSCCISLLRLRLRPS